MSHIECPPTPERVAKFGTNVAYGGQGRMTEGSVGERFRNHYELIADRDALPHDYGSAISRLSAARYAYLVAMKANEGWRADTSSEGDAGGIPLADYYTALVKRFSDQSKAMYRHTGHASGHWHTLMMLIKPLPDYCDTKRTGDAMFAIVPQIVTALDLLEEYGEAIQRDWKKANAPSREDEERAR